MNRNGYDEKASDLGRGRRPKLKSEDFSSYPIPVHEIQKVQKCDRFHLALHIFGA